MFESHPEQEKLALISKHDDNHDNDNDNDNDNDIQKNANTITLHYSSLIILIGLILGLLCSLIAVALLFLLEENNDSTLDYETYHRRFQNLVKPEEIKESIRSYSSNPHVAGTPQDWLQAEDTLKRWKSYGIDARIETIPVLLTYPRNSSVVKMVYPKDYTCLLKEVEVNDSTSGRQDTPPIWIGWSANGTVEERELVYVNYGTKEDFDAISHINLTGKVVIVRYGKIFRGNKAKFAEERGAAAVLIYSDPQDTQQGPSYPFGPWGTNSSAQRGAVWVGSGDPLTPGWPSSNLSPRISLAEAQEGSNLTIFGKLPGIPVQSLSSGDAFILLKNLGNNLIPNSTWSGGFNLSFIGPGSAKVSVSVDVSFNTTNIWNVVGIVKGSVEPDRMVIIGSHRDAWSFGAVDPISGHACISEIARVIGELLRQGWKPRRTIIFCSWDAEEYGLIGSFEFTEKWNKQLAASTIAYLNLDIAVTGADVLNVYGTPALSSILFELTQSITVPLPKEGSATLFTLWPSQQVNLLGEQSDYASFIQRLGIASLHVSLLSKPDSYQGVYHSNYDSYYWVSQFGDPSFERHASIVRLYGLLLLSLSDSPVVPFNYSFYSDRIDDLIAQLNSSALGALNVTCLSLAALKFRNATEYAGKNYLPDKKTNLQLRAINDALMLTERAFLTEDQLLTDHPYYRHVICTPSKDNRYSGSAFPAIYHALEKKDLKKAQFIADRIALVIDAAAGVLTTSIIGKDVN